MSNRTCYECNNTPICKTWNKARDMVMTEASYLDFTEVEFRDYFDVIARRCKFFNGENNAENSA